jgi:hypothetical protein
MIKTAEEKAMDKKLKQSLKVATIRKEMVVVWLKNGDRVKGIADVSADLERLKINTIEETVWLPYKEVESVSRVVRLRIEGEASE